MLYPLVSDVLGDAFRHVTEMLVYTSPDVVKPQIYMSFDPGIVFNKNNYMRLRQLRWDSRTPGPRILQPFGFTP